MLFRRLGEMAHRHRYLIIGAWLTAAIVLNVAVPQLEDVIKRDATTFIPASSEAMLAYQLMGQKFGGASGRGFAIVVLENKRGLSPADSAYYASVVSRLTHAHDRVEMVQDYISHPELKDALVSKDGKAAYIPVGLRHVVGTPEGDSDAPWMRHQLSMGKPSDLSAYVTGTTAIIGDFQDSIQSSVQKTTLITLGLLIIILLLVYRSPVTPVIPMTTIGLSIMVVRPIVALLGLHWIKVASFTETFLIAIVFGAGTDYCIFLISRFKEQMAQGDTEPRAVSTTWHRVGEAIASSAGTVLVGGLAMLTANVALFSTTGPAIAVAVVVTLLAGLTLTPALIALGGQRFFWPRGFAHERPGRFWTRASQLIVSRPRRVLGWSLAPLLLLAALYPAMRLTYDERSPQPDSNGSMQGLHALDRHFQSGEILPDYVLVQSNQDLRNPTDLATLDNGTRAMARVFGVASVRSFTQPTGTRIEQASLAYQAGQVGQGLGQARDQLQAGSAGVARLDQGGQQLSNGAGQLSAGAQQAQSATDLFITGLGQENAGLGQAVTGTGAAQSGASGLRDGARQLSAGLGAAKAGVQQAVDQLQLAIAALDADPTCAVTPQCIEARARVQAVHDAQRDKLLPGLGQAQAGANQIAAGNGDLATGLGQLHDGLVKAQAGIAQLDAGERTFKSKLGQLAGGAGQLSGGAAQLSGGVSQLTTGADQLKSGLGQAADYLQTASREAQQAGIDTFFIPAGRLGDPQLALARYYYLSADGTTARMLVLGRDDPFGTSAMARVPRERDALLRALSGTRLAGAHVLITGEAPLNANLQSYFLRDFRVVAIAVLLGVLIVLVLLLRSLVAPIYLLLSVLLSYAAAMGLTTLVWQVIARKGYIDWTVPIFAFVMLVAVGADYNIFLMSRVREEVSRDPQAGIGRAIARTGAIITSAGIIFAGTFAAMVTAPVVNIAEAGFAITCGLLLDTFLVRSFVVPSVAVLLGRWNWWPYLGMPAGVPARPRGTRAGSGAGAPQPAR